ncbi:MAG: 4-alpha-glucanotransferase [Anaerolineales bacterium]|nr:4-alpha-glucanotransferase [Chloroflexota bacterium]MBL6980167.1 4-alpha-glucanotransferase [Anaerolineales bacterium]
MKFERSSGVLLHPTSLPGSYGIGDIGPKAHEWIDFLSTSGCNLWQVLPLGPTGYGDSPYQCFSAFAGNPYIISPDSLLSNGLLTYDDIRDRPSFQIEKVDYGKVIPYKIKLLNRAFENFQSNAHSQAGKAFQTFCKNEVHWLDDYALFMTIKEVQGGGPWVDWPAHLRNRDTAALNTFKDEYAADITRQAFWQFLFFQQWSALRKYAIKRGINIIGDIPIFVAHDSADVWANPELFLLDKSGRPTVVAGVPPDYFSPTGQLWGNPLYRWDIHAENDYRWWLDRLRAVFSMVDIVRLDHFRGFSGYWEIPADEETAENGQWVPGPGAKFFDAVKKSLVSLSIIAEDLGEITPDVVELRDQFDLPGMKILVFAFDSDEENEFLPHNYHTPNCVVYTGTHDNDTTRGWYERADDKIRDYARRYLARDGHDIAWDLIRAAWSSVAVFALAPLQDLLNLGNEARMNYPSKPSGNWLWRMSPRTLTDSLRARLQDMNHLYARHSKSTMEKSE